MDTIAISRNEYGRVEGITIPFPSGGTLFSGLTFALIAAVVFMKRKTLFK